MIKSFLHFSKIHLVLGRPVDAVFVWNHLSDDADLYPYRNENTDSLDTYHRLSQTYAELATSGPLLGRVRDKLALTIDPGDLASRVNAQATNQGIVVIDVTGPDGEEAARISNAIAAEILELATPPGQPSSIAEVIEPANPPAHATTPNVAVNTLVAAFLGFFLALGAALVVANRRPATVRTAEAAGVAWPERS